MTTFLRIYIGRFRPSRVSGWQPSQRMPKPRWV